LRRTSKWIVGGLLVLPLSAAVVALIQSLGAEPAAISTGSASRDRGELDAAGSMPSLAVEREDVRTDGRAPVDGVAPNAVLCRLVGRVLRATGRPEIGALVTCRAAQGDPRFSPTDEQGRFSFDVVELQKTTIFADVDGVRTDDVEAVPQQGTTDLGDLVLRPARKLVAVVADESGREVAGARLRVRSTSGSRLAIADSSGRAELGLVPEGALRLSVENAGLRILRPEGGRVPESSEREIQVILGRGGTLHGTVRSSDGSLLGKVDVTAKSDYVDEERVTLTDEHGAYNLELDPDRSWRVKFERAGWRTELRSEVDSAGGPLDVVMAAGHRCRAHLRGVDPRAGAAELRLLRSRLKPHEQVNEERAVSAEIVPLDGETFELWFTGRGTYFVEARALGMAWSRSEPVEIESDEVACERSVEIDLGRGRAVTFRIRGDVPRGSWLYLRRRDPGDATARIRELARGSFERRIGGVVGVVASARIADQGTATVRGLESRSYELLLAGPKGVPAASLGAVEITDATDALDVESPGFGDLEGRVVDAASVALGGARVICCRETGSFDVAVTDGDGRFRIASIPSGDYAVRAWRIGESLRIQCGGGTLWISEDGNFGVQGTTNARPADVATVPESGVATSAIVVRAERGVVRGRVRMDDVPLPGAQIRVAADLGPRAAVSGADGEFELTGLPLGGTTLQVVLEGRVWAEQRVEAVLPEIEQPRETWIDLQSARFSLRLIDARSRAPIVGAVVGVTDDRSAGRRRLDGPLRFAGATDADGRFETRRMPPVDLRVDVLARGYRRPVALVTTEELLEGEVREIELESGGWIVVRRDLDPSLSTASGVRYLLLFRDRSERDGVDWFDASGAAWIEIDQAEGMTLTLEPIGVPNARPIVREVTIAPGEVVRLGGAIAK
jgi:hypothetical protein